MSQVECRVEDVVRAARNLKNSIYKWRMRKLKEQAQACARGSSFQRVLRRFFRLPEHEPTRAQVAKAARVLWTSYEEWAPVYRCGGGLSLEEAEELLSACRVAVGETIMLTTKQAALVSEWLPKAKERK